MYISVIGAGHCDRETAQAACEVGKRIAKAGAVLVCGGMSGVMEAACRGAKEAGGRTVGILPTEDRSSGNKYLDLALPTGMGEGRNVLVVRAGDAVIAIGGEFGTLSEIGLALKMGKPVIGLGTWKLAKPGEPKKDYIIEASTPGEAVEKALVSLRSNFKL